MNTATTVSATARVKGVRTPVIAVVGFLLIWAFLILFVLFPLTRIFYDAFTNEAGQFTAANFIEFFTDG
ncbi:MAG TPA: iron ABC transporter permease, partial [Candidatus Binatia bacterium]|nr:iron ABC transporter permease [Candidatus Binatia bacterium]